MGGRTGTASAPLAAAQELLAKDEIKLWAHDDGLEPGGIYRYRIRIGFFNPIAGKDWFETDNEELKKQIVLWS